MVAYRGTLECLKITFLEEPAFKVRHFRHKCFELLLDTKYQVKNQAQNSESEKFLVRYQVQKDPKSICVVKA